MKDEGKTIVFVTHDMGSLRRFCHRALLLERGSPVHVGTPEEVADRYLEINFGREASAAEASGDRMGDGEARVIDVWTETEAGERSVAVPQGQRITLRVLVEFMVAVEDPQVGVYVLNEDQRAVVVTNSAVGQASSGDFSAGEQAQFSFSFDNVLAPGRYSPLITLAHRGMGLDVMDRYESSFSFVVTSSNAAGGTVDLPTEVEIERVGSPVREQASA
jgi:hypothetical protein